MAYKGHIKQFVFQKDGVNGLKYVPAVDSRYTDDRTDARGDTGNLTTEGLLASTSGFGYINRIVDHAATNRVRAAARLADVDDSEGQVVYVNTYEVVDALPHNLSNSGVRSVDMNDTVAPGDFVEAERLANNLNVDLLTYNEDHVLWQLREHSTHGDTEPEAGDYLIFETLLGDATRQVIDINFDSDHPGNADITLYADDNTTFQITVNEGMSVANVRQEIIHQLGLRAFTFLPPADFVDSELVWEIGERAPRSGSVTGGHIRFDYTSISIDGDDSENIYVEGYVGNVTGPATNRVALVYPTSVASGWDTLIDASNPSHVDVYRPNDGRIVRGRTVNGIEIADNRGPGGNGDSAVPTPEVDPFNL